jgi:DNA-directed RNA polymerase specialized sigma24 family protein
MEERSMNEEKKYYVEVEGQTVEVTKDVYYAFKRPIWKERKRREVRKSYEVSFEQVEEVIPSLGPTLEDSVIEKTLLSEAYITLTKREQIVIRALFYEGFTECEFANDFGIAQQNVNKSKKRAMKKFLKYFSE